MGMAVKVRMLRAAKGSKLMELAEKMEPKTTSQNLSGKLKRDNFSEKDLQSIAKACGVKFEANFILEDGTKIWNMQFAI